MSALGIRARARSRQRFYLPYNGNRVYCLARPPSKWSWTHHSPQVAEGIVGQVEDDDASDRAEYIDGLADAAEGNAED